MSLPRYDPLQTYQWNYDHAPTQGPVCDVSPAQGDWSLCGRKLPSPLGVAAGPLLNGRWILYYAALGFDLLTYKTVRSRERACYPLPNLLPVQAGEIAEAGRELVAASAMQGSWAVSFGMPSMAPEVWRADIEWTRRQLPNEKVLSVSVVATPEPDWTLDHLAADYARCARWAVESGADMIETNFSCPNVASCDGQLYQQPAAAGLVASRVREAIGNTSLSIKVGYFAPSDPRAEQLLDAVAPYANVLAMTNCISARVRDASGVALFDGQPRGIGGEAIRPASAAQVQRFADAAKQRQYATQIIGVGGITEASHVREYLTAGAQAVQLATSAMLDPLVAVKIRQAL
jgi:dihydroorotate dehydrogenase (NAD+) catalytic subunit